MAVPGRRGEITELCRLASQGQASAAEQLFRFVYDTLLEIAGGELRRRHRRLAGVLQPADLVHEAYLRVFARRFPDLSSRRHLYEYVAKTIRRLLLDYVEKETRLQRCPGFHRMIGEVVEVLEEERDLRLQELSRALDALQSEDPDQAYLVESSCFNGRATSDLARDLGLSERTTRRRLEQAKEWLRRRLHHPG